MGRRGAYAACLCALGALVLPATALWAKGNDAAARRAELAATDATTAAAAATALGAQKTPAALEALLDALSLGLVPDVAAAALDAVARHGADRSLPVLLAYARHRNPLVRAHAIQALAGLAGSAPATQAVLAALGDEEASVRGAAGKALAVRKDPRAVAPLLTLLASGGPARGRPLAARGGPARA